VAVKLVDGYDKSSDATAVVLDHADLLSSDDLSKVLRRFTSLALGPPLGMHMGGSDPVRLDATPVKTLYSKRRGDICDVVEKLIGDTSPSKIGGAVEVILSVRDDDLLRKHSRTIFAKLMRRRNLLPGERRKLKALADSWADTTSPTGKLILTVLGGLAEFERSLIAERTTEGRERAKRAGKRMGRPPKLSTYQRDVALKMRSEGQDNAEIARVLGVSRSTISRIK